MQRRIAAQMAPRKNQTSLAKVRSTRSTFESQPTRRYSGEVPDHCAAFRVSHCQEGYLSTKALYRLVLSKPWKSWPTCTTWPTILPTAPCSGLIWMCSSSYTALSTCSLAVGQRRRRSLSRNFRLLQVLLVRATSHATLATREDYLRRVDTARSN